MVKRERCDGRILSLPGSWQPPIMTFTFEMGLPQKHLSFSNFPENNVPGVAVTCFLRGGFFQEAGGATSELLRLTETVKDRGYFSSGSRLMAQFYAVGVCCNSTGEVFIWIFSVVAGFTFRVSDSDPIELADSAEIYPKGKTGYHRKYSYKNFPVELQHTPTRRIDH